MQFKNPKNGYVETRTFPWLWALFFGIFYYIASGLWTIVIILTLLMVMLFMLMGDDSIAIIVLVHIGLAMAASSLVRNSYLKNGWVEVDDNNLLKSISYTDVDNEKTCPFCAEKIRIEAIKCKHCGSMLEKIVSQNPSFEERLTDDERMKEYGIRFNGHQYIFGEYRYDKLSDAINYAKIQNTQ